MCGYFHRCIYQHRFVEEIWRSSSAMRLCSIPTALARSGEMRSGNKFDLVKCIHSLSYTETVSNQPKVPAVVLEGSVLVNLVERKKNQSFKDYATEANPEANEQIFCSASRYCIWHV